MNDVIYEPKFIRISKKETNDFQNEETNDFNTESLSLIDFKRGNKYNMTCISPLPLAVCCYD